jgi:four helix bundle protein
MAGVKKFEELTAWQKARVLTKRIYASTEVDRFARDFGLRDQIRRASVSIMSNIAEGFERVNPNEFHHFLMIAKASCAEVRSQLYIAHDVGYLAQPEFSELMSMAIEVGNTIGALRASIDRYRKQ